MLGTEERREAARALARAWEAAEPIPPLTDRWPGMDLTDAYGVQEEFLAGRPPSPRIGWKVGLTSQAMRDQLGVDQPDFGPLRADMEVEDGGGCPVDRMIAPRVEGEIAFVMRTRLAGEDVRLDDALAAAGSVLPALEIIDSRIADWKIRLADTIADHASCALFVRGAERPLADIDLAAVEMRLREDGAEVGSGTGAAVMGHPAEAVAWLARTLAPLGLALEPGDLVLAGALSASVPVAPGASVEAQFEGGLGTVAVNFLEKEQG